MGSIITEIDYILKIIIVSILGLSTLFGLYVNFLENYILEKFKERHRMKKSIRRFSDADPYGEEDWNL